MFSVSVSVCMRVLMCMVVLNVVDGCGIIHPRTFGATHIHPSSVLLIHDRNYRFQPRFEGYQQHDSSEFLGFLLDGLHEDLNLVKQKPATSMPDLVDMTDAEGAQLAWETHVKRNQSYVDGLFFFFFLLAKRAL